MYYNSKDRTSEMVNPSAFFVNISGLATITWLASKTFCQTLVVNLI